MRASDPGGRIRPRSAEGRSAQLFGQAAGRCVGSGERLYRSGPWHQGTPSQGYQLPFTPAELFHTALRAIDTELKDTPFKDLPAEGQDAYLKSLEAGGKDLGGVPSAVFFQMLLQMT